MVTVKAEWPPSGLLARGLTLGALVFPILLALAILYQRKARDEAAASEGHYEWSRSLMNRPVALYLVAWATFLVVVFILMGVFAAFGVPPV